MESSPRLVAELGPTNTGKTFRAIERMLEHESGMMGLPLRLLAREVYDTVSARVGEARVALVTGEEKRVPPRPSYWVCTVEAMPVGEPVDFLAVDEVQLCAHRERGHVFTDRLLHARGRKETWFLGAEAMTPVLRALLPEVSFRRSERLSRLTSFGAKSLKSLPPRSAVVAFSTERVYELAQALRQLRGGVAVVLGALSPRTRNAQVALYQAREVEYLVATDAIGLGLNLDLERVAFASLSKFDGFEQRELTVDELGQIAGRAGRHVRDGEFGTLTSAPALSPRAIAAIEAHRFPAVSRLVWRSSELDFASPRALLDSLSVGPPHEVFSRVERADDFDALKALAEDAEVLSVASDRAGVELLWQVCRIPDFRKGLLGEHPRLVKELFLQLARGQGRLRDEWLSRQVEPLDDLKGDLHTLTARLEAIRTWTYLSHQRGWVNDAQAWQQRTRAIEDGLGDALHQRLVERFVEKSAVAARRRRAAPSTVTASGPFSKLAQHLERGEGPDEFVQRVVAARTDALHVDALGAIAFEGEVLGRLVRGSDLLTPAVALVDADAWNGGQRAQLERRFAACARDVVSEAMGGFPVQSLTSAGHPPPLRAIAWRFGRGLGLVRWDAELREHVRRLDAESHQRLDAAGVRQGARFLVVEQAATVAALERRGLLTALFSERPRPPEVPRVPVVRAEALGGGDVAAWGYERVGPMAVRVDVFETLLSVSQPARAGAVCQQLGVDASTTRWLLGALASPQKDP
ncbi:MAG: helicase-related protein [Myxococcaceae bacterium]|nr:helicase-related protein [Myxococcaceae bacterium]